MNSLKLLIIAIFPLSLSSCGGCSSDKSDTSYLEALPYDITIDTAIKEKASEPFTSGNVIIIPYTEQNDNIITLPVKINGMDLDLIFDTGASTTLLTRAEARYLFEKGNLVYEDLIDYQQYQIANGQIVTGLRINLRNVVIGDKITLHNIEAIVIENQRAPLLLGQSVMKQFREISIDRENRVVKFFE